jgi:hypothetical protein
MIKDENTEALIQRTKFNKGLDSDNFYKQKRHFFIMTDGGKPVYSRYGDEMENNGIFATLSAIITKLIHFTGTDEKLQ